MALNTRPPHALLLEPIVRYALEEDLGRSGDVTSDLVVPADRHAKARLFARDAGTVAGLVAAQAAFRLVDPLLDFQFEVKDGDQVTAEARLATVEGSARDILTAERVALNFVGHLSGIATATRALVHTQDHARASHIGKICRAMRRRL